ncbi:MAG: hypothetical protein GC162_15635 [Planctomycetes bacterium]|nr:hypothetical protein [Planctomycetota bacterium]
MKKRILRIGIVLLVLLIGAGALPFVRDAVGNSWRCRQFEHGVVGLDHAPGTRAVDVRSRVGLLYGNGNHCDYFAGQLRTYDGDFAKVEAHYAGLTFYNPVRESRDNVSVERVGPGELPYGDIVSWRVPEGLKEPMYLVYVFRNYDANADPRCN